MKLRGTRFWLAVLSGAAVVLVATVDMRRTSPGPLTAVHQREKDLEGRSGCSECHGGWLSGMTDSCLACHEVIEAQIEAAEGLHGALERGQAQRCAQCHSEHNGPGFALVNRQSFALAGAPSIEGFDHRLVDFLMEGAHLELSCAECHVHADEAVLAKGKLRYIGLDQECSTCHEDVHEGRFEIACASCHGQATWDGLQSLGHERHLPLIGGHGDAGCRDCHAEDGSHSLEILGSSQGRPRRRECLDCHDSPHAVGFVESVAQSIRLSPGASCVQCHAAEHETFRDPGLEMTPALHAGSGFLLDPPHDEAACADCHEPEGDDFAARYPGRGADQCSDCHEDVHAGQFAQGPFAGGDCSACHDRLQFEPHAFTVEKHALAALVLDGAHLDIECNDCHEDPAEGEPRAFRGTPSDCAGCHADAHAGFFEPFARGLPAVLNGECARCHGTQSFADVPAERFDHRRWTAFPVEGAHAQSGCESCHPPAGEPDDAGRTFGRVSERFGTYSGCATCHEDPHQGEFDGPSRPAAASSTSTDPREAGGREGCARCHVESSFRSFPHGFDHGAWTRFAVVGAHEAAGCSACHARLRKPDGHGRTWSRAAGPLCGDCHQDPHAGQFDVSGATDCERCHVSDEPSYLAFDHDRDSRFALHEAHEALECSACHFQTLQGGLQVVRYRPLPTECADCHGVHEEVLLRRMPRKK